MSTQTRHPCLRSAQTKVLTVAVVAAAYFHNRHARALQVMLGMHYLSGRLSTSRFNRCLHTPADWIGLALAILGDPFAAGGAFVLNSLPLPVCRRVRARHCGKVRDRGYCGYCAAKREKFFGWRLHLAVTPLGVPVAFAVLPAACHDLTPVHELTVGLPADACAYGDKKFDSRADEASILADTGVRLVPIRRANMAPNPWADRSRRSGRTAGASRPPKANWRRWASSGSTHAPIPASNSRSMPRSWPSPSPTRTSNQGRLGMTHRETTLHAPGVRALQR